MRPSPGSIYIVVSGDTLRNVARAAYGNDHGVGRVQYPPRRHVTDEIRGFYPIETEPLTYRERAQYGATDGKGEPRHFEDADQRRAVKAIMVFDEMFPWAIMGLSDGAYRKLETKLRKAFRRITREENQGQARRRDRTVRDGG